MRKYGLLFFLLALSALGYSQDRYEGWVRLNLNHWFQPKLGIGLELHHRRQANYWTSDKNMLEESMLTIVRPWIYLKLPSKWILSTSPLSYHGRNRAWYELRFTNVNQATYFFQTRVRIQNTWLLPLATINKQTRLNYNFTNEFFISQRRELIQFDHNRLFNGLQLKWGPQEISVGYQWSSHNVNPFSISRHQLFVNASFDL